MQTGPVRVSNGPLTLVLDQRGPRIDVLWEGIPMVEDGRLVSTPKTPLFPEGAWDLGGGAVRVAWGGPVAIEIEVRPTGPGFVLAGRVTRRAMGTWRPDAVVHLRATGVMGGAAPASIRTLRNGWQSWSLASNLAVPDHVPPARPAILARMAEDPAAPRRAEAGRHLAHWVTFLSHPATRRALVCGFPSTRRSAADIEVDGRGPGVRIAARERLEGVCLAQGESRDLAPLFLAAGTDLAGLLAAFADEAARVAGVRLTGEPPTGWCSWYRYYRGVTEAVVRDNARRLAEARDALPVGYVQVDDGWQGRVGDWDANPRAFPSGMGPLAADLARTGFLPGLWLAPFVVERRSRLFRRHPDWLLKDPVSGYPLAAGWNPAWDPWRPFHALDPTVPEAMDHVGRIVRRAVQEWGFHVIKIDFLYAAALPALRDDRAATSVEAYVRGLTAIRRAAGDAFVIGCGAPLAPSVGLVDAMRVGPDVAPWWRSRVQEHLFGGGNGMGAYHGIRNALARWFLNGRVWWNDPDCLLARSVLTNLSEDEVQALAAAVTASGGLKVISDAVTDLTPDRVALASQVLSTRAGAMVPSDPDRVPCPCAFSGNREGDAGRLSARVPFPS